MAAPNHKKRWQPDGKFFRSGSERVWMKAVTYGPFPGGWPESFESDFSQMAAAGFNAIRLYEMPDRRLLDEASHHGLQVFGGLKWGQYVDFLDHPAHFSAAKISLVNALKLTAQHPALAGVYVGNEIPTDMVRWMGPTKVLQAIEELITLGKELAPSLMFAYANYPSTEYLEPSNADFTAFNVYLENEDAFQSYLQRLHHIAGDRPVVISEFGMDSQRNGLEKQAEVLAWGVQTAMDLETAGMTVYAWSDRWWNGGAEILDWDFGLLQRDGLPKPTLAAVQDRPLPTATSTAELVSVIVCTRNGKARIGACLAALGRMTDQHYEVIVADDGSVDGTAEYVSAKFPSVRLLRLAPGGLGVARNAGAAAAGGEILAFTDDDCEPDHEWISRIRPIFKNGIYQAACGPNLPPKPRSWQEAVVCAAPGAPSHVMLDDREAEHLPGCNLVVTKAAFLAVGGFDPEFHTAGDDVDFCWRLRDAGFKLGFVPGAFVWHWRRPSLMAFLRQQGGYGKAERLLIVKHPKHFSPDGETRWQGFVYGGGPMRVTSESIIYHGSMGEAGYQGIVNRMLPLRNLEARYATPFTIFCLGMIRFLQPMLRAWARNRRMVLPLRASLKTSPKSSSEDFRLPLETGKTREDVLAYFLDNNWRPADVYAPWDLEKGRDRILVAIEMGERGTATALLRIWGKPPEIYRLKARRGLFETTILSSNMVPLA